MTQLSLFDSEQWRDVPGYEGRYQVSNLGRIKSFCRLAPGATERILSNSPSGEGYVVVHLRRDKTPMAFNVHQLVMSVFVGDRPQGAYINHKNGVKTDNRLVNLEYVTPAENAQHAIRTGLVNFESRSGANNCNTKLTQEHVNEIRRLYLETPLTQANIATRFGITEAAANAIITNRNWHDSNYHRPIRTRKSGAQ